MTDLFDSPDPSARITAIRSIRAPGSGIIQRLEWLALKDPDAGVRQAALEALGRPEIARFPRSTLRELALNQRLRAEVIQQITQWAMAGRLSPEQWRVLRGRYGFDFTPPPLSQEGARALDSAVVDWQREGLVSAEQAEALRRDFGGGTGAAQVPAAQAPQPTPAASPQPAVSTAKESPAPSAAPALQPAERRTVMDILFSEVSIRIALYLGGFLVVAAALILAALIEVARMPILLALTAACGGSAFALRKRLPLPAHVLFMLFAALLPIDARVLADTLRISGADLWLFWSVTWTVEALVLGAGGLVYNSRLLALAAFGAVNAAAVYAGLRWDEQNSFETITAALSIGGLVAVGWMVLLKRVKGLSFALPVVWVAQPQTALLLLFAFSWLVIRAIDPGEATRAAVPIPWLIGTLTFVLADALVVRFFAFPPIAVGALLFFPYTLLSALNIQPEVIKIAMAATALVFLASGVLLVREKARAVRGYTLGQYGPWLLMGAVTLMAWSAGWITNENPDNTVIPFTYLCLWAVALSGAAAELQRQPYARVPLWIAALFAALAAYFLFYALPFVHIERMTISYELLIPTVIYLLPTLILRPDLKRHPGWHVPLLGYGLLLFLVTGMFVVFGAESSPEDGLANAIALTVLALTCMIYALRFDAPWILFAWLVWAPLAMFRWLSYASIEGSFMLPTAGLAVAHYMIGYALAVRSTANGQAQETSQTAADKISPASRLQSLDWSAALRWVGLILGLFLLVLWPSSIQSRTNSFSLADAAALAVGGGLYLVELLRPRTIAERSRWFWLEYAMDGLLIAALFRLLQGRAFDASHLAGALTGASLIVLGFDLFFTRFYPFGNATRWIPRLAGAVLTTITAAYLAGAPGLRPEVSAALFGLFALYFLIAGVLYPQPWLALGITASLSAGLFYALRWQGQAHWVGPLVGLAVVEYVLSWWLGRTNLPETGRSGTAPRTLDDFLFTNPGWTLSLQLSALALAMFISLTAPFENALSASIPVAAAASLYAIEAFRRRNVWIGFPANGLYLMAYFIVLYQLKVSEPQYYSLGVAALGMLMHYLLVRSGSRIGAFLTGMVSQLALLGTTYIQMASTQKLSFFVILFFQGLVVLAYGIVIRSRSLVITPLVFIVLGVITVVLSILSGVPTAIIIGCTGVLLLVLGILAVVLRERLMDATAKMGEWRA